MRILLIASIALIFGCNSSSDKTAIENDSEDLDYSGVLMPKLVADGKAIWDFGGRKSEDTLTRSTHELSFQLLNYSRYTDKSSDNPLEGINKIDFNLRTIGLNTTLNPSIQDSIGVLTLNLDTITSPSLRYSVDMNLKFKETDSTFKYSGVIHLQD